MSFPSKRYSLAESLKKARKFCAYQDRCHSEVRNKLYSFGLYKSEVEETLAQLITEGFLNEERFAKSFARGKHRYLGWGKIKVTQALKEKQIGDLLIKIALQEITEEEYLSTLRNLIEKKLTQLGKTIEDFETQQKLIKYALAKGYEYELVRKLLEF